MPRIKTTALAKFSRPRLRGAIARDRLFDLLDRARQERPGVCVVGPPGAGKTTLVASWLESRSIKGIWYQIDPGDVDLPTFFHYLGWAAQPFVRKNGRALPPLTPEYLGDIEAFSRRFFRELFSLLPRNAVLILDNYQDVPAGERFHVLIAQAIHEVPAGGLIAVISRRDPPECYSRLIANQNVSTIDSEDLKLTLTEAQAIARKHASYAEADVKRFHQLTEGWSAGLVLILEQSRRTEFALENTSGHYQLIFDYFADQILAQLDESTRQFLFATTWLPAISIHIAIALTGDARAQSILEDLYRRRLFVHRKEAAEVSYSFHALFQRFLQDRAARVMEPTRLEQLKVRAAHLLASDGQGESALQLYFSVGQWVPAVRLILQLAGPTLAQGRWAVVRDWISGLPQSEFEAEPWLRYWLGRTKLGFDPSGGRADFLSTLAAFEQRGDTIAQIMVLAAIMETHWLQWRDFAALDEFIARMIGLLDTGDIFPRPEMDLRAHTILLVALSHRRPGSPYMTVVQSRVMRLLQGKLEDNERLLAATILVGHALPPLDLQLPRWAEAMIGDLPEKGTVTTQMRINWYIRLACHYTHRGDYARAQQIMTHSEDLANAEGLSVGLVNRCWWGAFVSLHGHDLIRAGRYADTLAAATNITHQFKSGVIANIRCTVALAKGDIAVAVTNGRQASLIAFEDGPAWSIPYFAIPAIFALLEAGERTEAMALLEKVRAFVTGTFIGVFEAELQLAQAYLLLDHERATGEFTERLTAALSHARATEYNFCWRTQFRPHRILFTEALRLDIESAFLRSAIARFQMRPGDGAGEEWPWPIRIYVLGRFEVHVNDQPLKFGRKSPRKVLALLKAIIALGGNQIPGHRLMDALWPDEDGASASHSFRLALHRLRRTLGRADAILQEDGQITLNRAVAWDDVSAFQRACDPGSTQGLDGKGAALKLYRGDFLPGDEDAIWSMPMRASLRSAFSTAVRQMQSKAG